MSHVAVQAEPHSAPPPRAPYDRTDLLVLGSALAAAALCAVVASFGNMPRLQPMVGLIVILSIGTACTRQMSRQYSRIVRSEENLPVRAALRIDMRVQRSRSRYTSLTPFWHSTYAAKSANTRYGS